MTEIGRLSFRFTLIVALAATLGLTACGRKGPLDPPPAAAAPTAGAPGNSSAADEEPKPQAPDRRIPLDVLLN